MKRTRSRALRVGEWAVRFNASTSGLDCRHSESGTRLRGKLGFRGTAGGTELVAWKLVPGGEGHADDLALVDPKGDCQGYVAFDADGARLRLSVIQRPPQRRHGTLQLDAESALGKQTFACRTFPPGAASQVVQMAAGPADSLLNDSLFDIPTDTALRFSAASVEIRTLPTGQRQRQRFRVNLEARAADEAACEMVASVERDYYRNRYVPWYKPIDKSRAPSPPTGWMSWNIYFDQAGEKENLDEARVGARYLKPYGMEIWSIESWQDNSGTQPVRNFHNLTLRPYAKQFPHGMKWLADQIRKLGFRPGIWTVPFGTGDKEYYEKHKQRFLHHPDGTPMSNWSGIYVLDPSQPAVRRHMASTHRKMAREWGYEFFKMDGISGRGPSYNAHFYERPEVRRAFKHKCPNPMELCLKALRRGIGQQNLFLACQGHYSGPEVEYCDATRIGADVVGVRQPVRWHNYVDQAVTTLAQLFVHNIVWYGDPDTLMVGPNGSLSEARIGATVVGLPGQMMFAGDKLGELAPERMWLLQRCLPVCDVRPLDLFPIYTPKPIWVLKVKRPFAEWNVVSLFNFSDREKQRFCLRPRDIGLEPDREYLVHDYWNRRLMRKLREKVEFTLKPKSNLLLAVHESLGRPQFTSTDRHVTQGGTSIETLQWDESSLTLRGRTRLVGGETTTMSFYVPAGFAFGKAVSRDAKAAALLTHRNRVLELSLSSVRSRCAGWKLLFKRPEGGRRGR